MFETYKNQPDGEIQKDEEQVPGGKIVVYRHIVFVGMRYGGDEIHEVKSMTSVFVPNVTNKE